MIGLPYSEKKNYDDMLSRFHLIPERYGRTDRRTDLLYQYRASVCWCAIKKTVGATAALAIWKSLTTDMITYTITCLDSKPAEAKLLQRDRAMSRVIEYFPNLLKITQSHSQWHTWERRKSLLVFRCNCVCTSYRFWDIQCQRMTWPWKLDQELFKVIEDRPVR